MCKTHCLDSEESEKESFHKKQTPALKISYKAPDGHSVMDIVPKKLKKRKHHSKHKKDKKHKSSRHDFDRHDLSLKEPNSSADDSSMDKKLVINLPKLSETSVASITSGNLNPENCIKSKLKPSNQSSDAVEESSIVSERRSRSVTIYQNNDGKQISVGDVVWGKIIGFPWWPGRVCAINATETADGIILDHIADVDWYCSPTKSHLPCSQLWPFLDEYEKR